MKNWKQIFAIIWSGQAASILTSQIVGFAIIFWLSIETGSAEVLALAAMAGLLPQALLGVVVGAYVDRWDRKVTMILADGFIALSTLTLAILFWLDIAQMWHIYVLLACRSVGTAFHMPAMQASVPLLAPKSELTRIAGINQIIHSASNIAGPALGALLITMTGLGNILLLDVAGAVLACTSLFFVRIPRPEREEEHHILREIHEGFLAIYRTRGMTWLFLLDVLAFFFIIPIGVLFPLMTLEHFGGDTFEMSAIEVVWGGGALLGGIIMGVRKYKINRIILINLMHLLVGASFIASGLLPISGFVWFALLTTAAGIAGSILQTAFLAVVQSHFDQAVLGRVLSLYYGFNLLPAVIGLIGTGFFAEQVGLSAAFYLAGGVICAIGILSFCIPSVMHIDRKAQKKGQENPAP